MPLFLFEICNKQHINWYRMSWGTNDWFDFNPVSFTLVWLCNALRPTPTPSLFFLLPTLTFPSLLHITPIVNMSHIIPYISSGVIHMKTHLHILTLKDRLLKVSFLDLHLDVGTHWVTLEKLSKLSDAVFLLRKWGL